MSHSIWLTALTFAAFTISCKTRRDAVSRSIPLSEETQEEEPLFPPKEFLRDEEIPKLILEKARSVRRLCTGVVAQDTCLTIFAIEKPAMFVTNEHAFSSLEEDGKKRGWVTRVQKDETQEIKVEEGQKVTPRILARGRGDFFNAEADHRDDLIFFRIPELSSVKSLNIAKTCPAEEGSQAYHLGFPVGYHLDQFRPKVSDGKIKGRHRTSRIGNFLGTNGTSGGPVLDQRGDVIGVFWGKEATFREKPLRLREALGNVPAERSYFIDCNDVKSFMAENKLISE